MVNSVVLMLSQYGKNGKMQNFFMFMWFIIVAVISSVNFSFAFLIFELIAFLLTTGCIRVINRLNSDISELMSVSSILIYSIFIDVLCYGFFHECTANQSLIAYIMNGLAFNLKYVALNTVVMVFIVLYSRTLKRLPLRFIYERKFSTT